VSNTLLKRHFLKNFGGQSKILERLLGTRSILKGAEPNSNKPGMGAYTAPAIASSKTTQRSRVYELKMNA